MSLFIRRNISFNYLQPSSTLHSEQDDCDSTFSHSRELLAQQGDQLCTEFPNFLGFPFVVQGDHG